MAVSYWKRGKIIPFHSFACQGSYFLKNDCSNGKRLSIFISKSRFEERANDTSVPTIVFQNLRPFYTRAMTDTSHIRKGSKFSSTILANQLAENTLIVPRSFNHVKTANDNDSETNDDFISNSLHKLNLNVQRTGRAYILTVEEIFNALQVKGKCTSNEALLLLRCCGSFLTDEKPSVRAELSEKIWHFLQNSDIKLDTSHYNALLKNRLDNEGPDFQPSEILSTMEKNGVEANRVTFQHLIAKFCLSGDIQGATTILEHMKDQKLPVNENVFHSLIVGHSRIDDFEEAKAVMSLMVESGVDVDIDTRMIYVLELARAGKDFRKELEIIENQGLNLSDHEYFKLITLLVQKGEKEAALDISTKLPKKRGFFQEMRNYIPAMISSGELEVPFKILEEFAFPTKLGSEGHPDSIREDHGLFFLNSMVKNEYDPKLLIEYAKKLDTSKSTVFTRILEFCLKHGNIQYGQNVYGLIVSEFGDVLEPRDLSNFVRSRADSLKMQGIDPLSISSATIAFLVNMAAMGLRPYGSDIATSLMPNIMATGELPGKIMMKIQDKIQDLDNDGINIHEMKAKKLPYASISNSMIQYLLDTENILSFGRVIGYIASGNVPTKPHLWNSGLARSFLATERKDLLVSVLALCISDVKKFTNNQKDKEGLRDKNDEDLFQSLNQIVALAPRYQPNSLEEELLTPILRDLNELKIGIPATITSSLKNNVESHNDEFKMLLQELNENYEDKTYWTEERAKALVTRQREISFKIMSRYLPGYVDNRIIQDSGFIEPNKIPTDLRGLKHVLRVLEQKKLVNHIVLNNLITLYIESNDFEEADNLINKYGNSTFKLYFPLINKYVQKCIETSQLQKATEFLKYVTSKSLTHSFHVYVDLGTAIANLGHHDQVMELFNGIDIKCISESSLYYPKALEIVKYYFVKIDRQKAKDLYSILQDRKIIKQQTSFDNLSVSMKTGEYTIANEIDNFEIIAKEDKKLIQPVALLKKLAMKEDTAGIERVINASMDVIGEERSIYNLAVSFIETGKYAQAKKLLATPGLRYNKNLFQQIMARYLNKGFLDEIEKLVLFSRPLFACDREFMYSSLISACVKSKQYRKIEEAWVSMQEENFGPSDALKLQIAKGLMAGQLPIPFEV